MTQPRKGFHRHALAAAVVLALAGAAQAQLSTSTLKGQVTAGASAAQAGVPVVAVSKDNGNTYRTATRADGSYVLSGLAPGRYEIRVGDQGGNEVTLQVGETASLDLSAPGAGQQVTIVGSANRQAVKDSQVGTLVSRRMIEAMPQTSRNFLSSADLAPGVAFNSDGNGNSSIQAGSQNYDHVNVFIDGVGMKNNILRGGLTGQDSSRGNPFPQSAIAEYKVLTQNYKAEFDQVSSAAVTAITKSGTNELHGDVYIDRTGTSWRAMTPFERANEAAGVPLPGSSKSEYGFSLGGPIKADQVHFFVAYDGKTIDDSRQFVPQNLDKYDPTKGVIPALKAAEGSTVNRFREHLLFGKIDAQIDDENKLTFSAKLRRESDLLPEDKRLSAPDNMKDRSNDSTGLDLKHEWSRGDWLSEARLGYEDYHWNPHSNATSPFIKYKYSPTNTINNVNDIAFVGGSPDAQDRSQKGMFISEDLTWTGLTGHVLKGGLKLKNMKYSLAGTAFSVDTVETVVNTADGQPFYNGSTCTGTNISANGLDSDQCHIRAAIPAADVSFSNRQLGLYLQDDITVTQQLELNLGARWDYESNMLNNSYVTPADRVTALYALDGRTIAGITAPPGQTYAQSLAKGGINIADYISNGSSRKAFKGALAPRLGASYDVFGDKATVVFGGWGRSYDRTMANHALDELQKNKQTGGEIWLIKNEFKMPYADQFSLGLRQAVADWNAEVALSRIDAKNQFIWFGGNRDPNGGYGTQSPIDPLWGGPNGFGTLILGDFVGETRTTALLLKAEKPYTRSSGWAVNVAYTYSDAQTTSREWNNDIFDWTYGRTGARGWNPSTLVDKHRLVVAGLTDQLLPWGITLSGKMTYGSGKPRRITSCANGWNNCVSLEGESPSFRQIDVGLAKDIALGMGQATLRLDVLNLFNVVNYGGFDDWGGGPVAPGGQKNAVGGDNLNLGKPNSVRGDPRTVRLAIGYKF